MANEKSGAAVETKVKDPVCGKEVDTAKAMFMATHNGKTYYFCSDACKAEFMEEPERYTG